MRKLFLFLVALALAGASQASPGGYEINPGVLGTNTLTAPDGDLQLDGSTVWTEASDGADSGLDADNVQGRDLVAEHDNLKVSVVQNSKDILLLALQMTLRDATYGFPLLDSVGDTYDAAQVGMLWTDAATSTGETLDNTAYHSVAGVAGIAGVNHYEMTYAHFKANDSNATSVVADSNAGGNAGTLYLDASTANTEDVSTNGLLNSSLYLGEVLRGHHIRTGFDPSPYMQGGKWSWAMWLHFNDGRPSTDKIFIGVKNNDPTYDEMMWYLDADGGIHVRHRTDYGSGNSTFRIGSVGDIPDGDTGWIHFVLAYDSDGSTCDMYGYQDGALVSSNTLSDTWATADYEGDLWLGIPNWEGAPHPSSGNCNHPTSFDDVRIYTNHVLTAAEVTALYNSGTGSEASGFGGTPATAHTNMVLVSSNLNFITSADEAHVWVYTDGLDGTNSADFSVDVSMTNGPTPMWQTVPLGYGGLVTTNLSAWYGSSTNFAPATNFAYRIRTTNDINYGLFEAFGGGRR